MNDVLVGIGEFLLVAGIAFVALAVATSVIRFQQLTYRVSEARDVAPDDTFRMAIIQNLGTGHRAPDPFSIIVAEIPNLIELRNEHGEKVAEEMLQHLRNAGRENTRGPDSLHEISDTRIGIVVGAERQSGKYVAARIVESLNRSPCRCSSGLTIRIPASLGVSSFPENGDRVSGLIEAAQNALADAISKGVSTFVPAPALVADTEEPEKPTKEADRAADQSRLLDDLTGVLKPERVGTALQKYVAKYRKDSLPVSLMYIDVDNLDRYNQHYGMEAGDAVLKGMGRLLEDSLRMDDLIARVEADEFVVGLGCAPEEALITAQRLATNVKKESFRLGNALLKTTVCIGVAGAPKDGTNARSLFDAAYEALGEAKKRGRNICVRFHPAMRQQKARETRSDSF